MDETQFIRQSADLQLGGIETRQLLLSDASRGQALAGSSGSALVWNSATAMPYPDNGWQIAAASAPGDIDGLRNTRKFINRAKVAGALKTLLAAGAVADLLIDMQDRRLRNLALADDRLHPVFTFNRRIGDTSRILWPLPGYHDLDAAGFLGPSDWTRIDWRDKLPTIGWRGNLSGRADWHGDVTREGLRLKPLLKQFTRGKISADKAEKNLGQFPRHRLMLRYFDDCRFDIGFTGADGIALQGFPFVTRFIAERVSQPELSRHKFLLVLRGMDVGSSFYWTMNSGSLGLVMDTPFESFASGLFKPWVHYVPFKSDLSDLEQRIEWCRSNDDKCQIIAQRAGAMCQLIAQADLRQAVSAKVVNRLEQRIADCRQTSDPL